MTPMKPEDVTELLSFAERRLNELLALNEGDFAGADASERQQLLQEFFFHLVGATEVLAQLVNEVRRLGIPSEDVSVPVFACRLSGTDPVKRMLSSLHQRTKKKPLPSKPYGDEGYIFRILNYRHQVTHRRRNPFLFRMPGRSASLYLDPRVPVDPLHPSRGASEEFLQEEMDHMMELIRKKCKGVVALL